MISGGACSPAEASAPKWSRPLCVLLCAGFLVGASNVQAEEGSHVSDTEHIFGFTDGSDIGEKGEREVENTFNARFGKAGSYLAAEGETEFLYTVTDSFRASVGASFDYHSIQNVPDFIDRNAANLGGMSTEFRFRILDRGSSPIGLSLSVEPEYQRVDDLTGAPGQGYVLPITILIDRALVPDAVFAAANIIYTPGLGRFGSGNFQWQAQSSFAVYGAMTAVISPRIFLGAEVRYQSAFEGGFLNRSDGYAVTVGPSLCLQLAKDSFLKFAWASQVVGKAVDAPGTLDLVNFERNEARVRLVLGF